MPSFKDKVVIITGASSGIGEATAEYFAKLGATLVLCGRNVENLLKVSTSCESFGECPKPLIVSCDITADNFPETVVNSAIKEFGKLDILINNAGIAKLGGIDTMTMEQFDEVTDTNLRSVIRLTQEAVPHLIKTKGNIVNVSSFLGLRPSINMMSYAISKAALDQFTQCLSLEMAPHGVRVNSANPGVIVTEIHKRAGFTDDQYTKYLEYCKSIHPLGRAGYANEVATVIAFLASDDSSFMTGALLPIDGGKHATSAR